MIAYSLLTGDKIDIGEIIFNSLVNKLTEKHRKKYVAYPSKLNFHQNSSEVPLIELTEYMLIVVNYQALVSPTPSLEKLGKKKRNKHLVVTGLPVTNPDEGTCTSQLLPEGALIDPKDSGRNIQLIDMVLPSTIVTDQLDFEFLMKDSEDDLKELSDEEVYKVEDRIEDAFPLNTKDAVKDDPTINANVMEDTNAYVQNSTKLTELNLHMKEVVNTYKQSSTNLINHTELIREANILGLRNTLEVIQNTVNAQVAHHETLVNSYRSLG
ncbi:hypothetical protein Tco_1434595 [Tanacetum coccineum]